MKYMIISDIHGDIDNLKAALNQCNQHQCDYILLLGDLLNHGPRNGLPNKYSPMEIAEELNMYKHKIIAIKGNCDSEVDQMLLNFPIKSLYNQFFIGSHRIFMTHGHKYNENNLPPLHKGDILMCGHTHVPKCIEYSDFVYMNPGSVSIPKEDSAHGYLMLEDGIFIWKNLEGEVYQTYKFV